jgi:hypothetical protein
MLLRILAVIAFVIAIILFIVAAVGATPSPKDADFGLAAIAAGLALLALTPFDRTNVG